jgi:hypothetical protein
VPWWKKQPTPSPRPLPSDEVEPERYRGKPLLIVMENYVLHCIGELPDDKEPILLAVVQRVFGGDADWKRTVRAQLHLPDSIDDSIRAMWMRNQTIAANNNMSLSPIQFAKMFADTNFAPNLYAK